MALRDWAGRLTEAESHQADQANRLVIRKADGMTRNGSAVSERLLTTARRPDYLHVRPGDAARVGDRAGKLPRLSHLHECAPVGSRRDRCVPARDARGRAGDARRSVTRTQRRARPAA